MSDTTTLYFADGRAVPYDSLPEEVRQVILQQYRKDEQQRIDDSPNYGVWVLLFFAVAAYFAVRLAWKDKGTTVLLGSNDRRNRYVDYDQKRQALLSDYFVYEGRDLVIPPEQYEKILNRHFPYYRKLPAELKEKFISRTKKFLAGKTFLIKSNEPFIEMPVLISATAVQLSFGLKDYLLPHYQYIRVYPEEYFAKDSLRILAGHVYGNTITLAWSQFLKGYEEYTDGVNVGLHEMAHALYYQYLHAETFKPQAFIANFNEVMAEGKELYASPSTLFSKNAYKDLQEFWAESIELFFERPSDLRRENAELYDAIKDMLNQDPADTLYPLVAE